MAETKGLLILPREWRKLREAQLGDGDNDWKINFMKFASIRTSGRVGEPKWRDITQIGSVTLMEPFTPQKRWYRALVAYNAYGQEVGFPMTEFLYFFAHPWVLQQMIEKAKKPARKKSTR